MKYPNILFFILIIITFSYTFLIADNIHQATADGDIEQIKVMLKTNPKLAMQYDDEQDLPVRAAIINGHTEIAKLLIDHMDNIDAFNRGETTPLEIAAYIGNDEIVKLLLKKGADVNHSNKDQRTPLYYAARGGKTSTAVILIDNGAKINAKTIRGITPLRIALEYNNLELVDLLFTKGAKPDIKDNEDGIDLLHKFATIGRETLVENLIIQGLNIENRDNKKRTILHSAAAGGLTRFVNRLINKGFEVNVTDIYGSTPLHEAVFYGQTDTVNLLLSKGADINSSRPEGTRPLHLARECKHRDIEELLVAKGALDKPKDFPDLYGDYMGQETPGEVGVIFAPGIVSRGEYYYQIHGFFEDNSTCILFLWEQGQKINWPYWPPFIMKKYNNKWAPMYQSKLAGKPWFYNLENIPTGESIIFPWRKNIDGSGPSNELFLWKTKKTLDDWAEPVCFGSPINQGFDTWPSVSDDKTMYWHSWRAGSIGKDDIYMSKLENGEYSKAENLGKPINTEHTEHDAYIAPDGSYIIYSSYKPGGYGEDDIYISFKRKDGTWSEPQNLGYKINSKYSDNRAFVTRDGKYIFYTSMRTGNLDVYWVDAEVIEILKNE